jgi:hypothetical protein
MMPHKDINNLTLVDKIYFIIIALIAAVVHFSKRRLTDVSFYRKVLIFIYDGLTSGSIAIFTGLIIYGKEGNLAMSDMAGGTFTISNGGVYGSLMSSPILNPPQSGILGMHKIQKRPVAIGDNIEISFMIPKRLERIALELIEQEQLRLSFENSEKKED